MAARNQTDDAVFNSELRKHPAAGAAALGTSLLLGIGTAALPLALPKKKTTPARVAAGAVAVSAGVAAAFLLLDAILNHKRVTRIDRHLHNAFRQRRSRRSEKTIDATTLIGNGWIVGPVAALSAFEFARRRDLRAAIAILWSLAGAAVWSEALKVTIRRERPPEGREHESDYSFPSGHTLMSGSVYGMLAYTLATRDRFGTWRFPVAAALALIAPYIAFSRMYLGRHWPSDTAASAALAMAWDATLITFLRSN